MTFISHPNTTSRKVPSVFITGGTSGLGLAIAKRLIALGTEVHVLGREATELDALDCQRAYFFPLDLREVASLGKVGDYVEAKQIDHFVHSAAIYADEGSAMGTAQCVDLLTINLVAAVVLLKDVYEVFKKRRGGTIAVINSVAGISPNYSEAAYCASKHGLRGFVGSLQLDAYKNNVKIIEYYLGAMRTRMTAHRPNHANMMPPDEVANLVVQDVLSKCRVFSLRQEIRRFESI